MKLNHRRLIRLASGLLLAFSASLPARADYSSTVLSQGPVGYYRLNETALLPPTPGTTNYGSLGSSADGAYVGSPTRELPGPFSGSSAIAYDGLSQIVNVPWQSAINPSGAFTLEFWVNPNTAPNFAYVAASAELASPRSGWYLAQDDGSTFGLGSAFVVRFFNQNGTTPTLTVSAPVTTAHTWYHLVLSYDGTTARMYENGVLTSSAVGAIVGNVDAPLTLGCRSDISFYWPGQMAEPAVYPSGLSAARVAAHYGIATTNGAAYAAAVLADSPSVYFRFLEPNDTSAENIGTGGLLLSGKYQAGTSVGFAGPQPTEFSGFETNNTAVSVPGDGSAVVVPALNLNTNTVTISGWLNISTSGLNPGTGIIVCDSGATYAGLITDNVFAGTGLGYVWNADPATYSWSPAFDSGLGVLPENGWAYVALVVSPDKASIYLADSSDPNSFMSVTNYTSHPKQAFAGSTLLGSDAGDPSYSFAGGIDEVSIFNRSLAAGELFTQYATGVGGVAPKLFADPATPVDPVYNGNDFTLTADVGGTAPLGFQWYKASSGLIPGATSSAYTKVNPQITDSDDYYCIVTNSFGSVTTASANIQVLPQFTVSINSQSSDHNLFPGGTLDLKVSAVGGGLKYQWYKSSILLPGATNSEYAVASAVVTNTGIYTVVITNMINAVTSAPIVINVFAPSNSYESAIVADTPEAWYRLNETNGTILFDSMGRHDGVYTNGGGPNLPTLGVAGAVVGSADKAATFDSVNFGIVPFSEALNQQQFAIECWAKTSDTTTSRIPVSSHSGVPQGYYLQTYPLGSWSGGVSDGVNNYYVPSATSGDAIVPGEWKHVVMVFDTSLKVYINGQWDGLGYVDFTRNPSAPFIIGGLGPIPSTGNGFIGQIDEVLVYKHALTLAQVQAHYSAAKFPSPIAPFFTLTPVSQEVVSNAPVTLTGTADGPIPITYQWFKNGVAVSGATNTTLSFNADYSNAGAYYLRATNPNGSTNSPVATVKSVPPTPGYVNVTNGLVLHLKFDGDYQDSSGRGNHGTPTGVGDAPTIVDGVVGSGSLHYQTFTTTGVPISEDPSGTVTTSAYVTLGNPPDLHFGTGNFSVSYWVRLPAGYVNGDLPILCSAANSWGNAGVTFAPSYEAGGWSFSYNGIVQVYGDDNSINDGNWHHLVHTVDRAGYAYTYLDGSLVDSRLAAPIGNINVPGPLNIGQDPSGLYPEQGSADVDDLAVWTRALSAYEAYAVHYAATNSGASFDGPAAPISLNISSVGTNVVLTWTPGSTLGTLLEATSLGGPWTPVPVYSPSYTVPATASSKFYRLSFIE